MSVSRISFLAAVVLSLGSGVLHSAPTTDRWPEGFELDEEANSPDGNYGVLVPTRDAADDDEEKIPNKIVDLKSHRILGTIKGAHYFNGQNHHGLDVTWANDYSWCAVNYLGRFGYESITLIDLKDGAFKQAELGAHIEHALGGEVSRQSKGRETGANGNPAFNDGPGRQVKIRTTGFTNPKQLSDQLTLGALFSGTYDLATQKWLSSSVRAIDPNITEDLDFAFSCAPMDDSNIASAEDKFKWYDDSLNQVYRALRFLLPPERFAKVKKEQIAWLKTLEAAGSNDAKCKLMRERIGQLRELAW